MKQVMISCQRIQQTHTHIHTHTHPCIMAMSVRHNEHREERREAKHSMLPALQEVLRNVLSPGPHYVRCLQACSEQHGHDGENVGKLSLWRKANIK